MRIVWMVFAGLIALMVLVLPRLGRRAPKPETAAVSQTARPSNPVSSFASLHEPNRPGLTARADSIVAFGLAQRGTPYVYAGTSPLTGFDCSGFIMYTFAHFGVAVPHSTALLIDVGRPVARTDAQPGDIVVFTGTANPSTTPGHAGIVISKRGEVPLRFVHASSGRREPFVKVNQVEGSDYERRFMQVRRVLGAGEVATTRPQNTPATPRKTSIAAIPVPAVSVVAPAAVSAPALPQKLPTKKYAKAPSPAFRKHTVAKKPSIHKSKTAARATAKKAPVKKKVVKPAAKPKITTRKPGTR